MNKTINSLTYHGGQIPSKGATSEISISGTHGAVFTLTIKNGSGVNILEDPLEDIVIPKSGVYKLKQKFPAYESNDFTRIDNQEVYTIELLPRAHTMLSEDIEPIQLYQYIDPTITITSTSTHSIVGSDATLKGSAFLLPITKPSNFKTSSSSLFADKFGKITYDITVVNEGNLLYVSRRPDLSIDLKKSTDLKRNVGIVKGEETDVVLTLSPDNTDQFSTPIKEGMVYNSSYTYTKLFDSNVSDYNEMGFATKIRLTDTDNLRVGMSITGNNIKRNATITSIDSDTDITISLKQKLTRYDQLTFTKKVGGVVMSVNEDGIESGSLEPIPRNTELTFSNDSTSINGRIISKGSGTDTITLNGVYQVVMFGKEDVTFTQLTDNFISTTPNAHTQYIKTTKNTRVTFDVLAFDTDSNKSSKTPINEAQDDPSHGTVDESAWAAGVGTTTYTPKTNYTGTDKFYFYAHDGATLSTRTPIYITIT
jgi:hypothetical protein